MHDMTAPNLRDILARNLNLLIDAAAPHGVKRSVRAWALGRELDVRLITRLAKGEHAVTLDILDDIASACGLQSWQLLLPDFDPRAPQTMPITEEERKTLARLRRLLDAEAAP